MIHRFQFEGMIFHLKSARLIRSGELHEAVFEITTDPESSRSCIHHHSTRTVGDFRNSIRVFTEAVHGDSSTSIRVFTGNTVLHEFIGQSLNFVECGGVHLG
jgi:hypothetical protein